jgi:hypothetical protein
MELSDAELIQALRLLVERPGLIREWEQNFSEGVSKAFVRRGMTWKQRKTARDIIARVMTNLADLHNRPDLLASSRTKPTFTSVYASPPLPRVEPRTFHVHAQRPEEIAAALSQGGRNALRALADGEWHPTASKTADGAVVGSSAKMLARLRLAERVDAQNDTKKTRVRITKLGREVLATLPGEAGVPKGVWG